MTEHDPDLFGLPFDLYERYLLASKIADAVRDREQRCSILDVGGGPSPLARFLPNDLIVATDLKGALEGQPVPKIFVYGDGTQLPFRSDAIDLVISLDTLEHVPPQLRQKFVADLCRVSRRGVMFTYPARASGVPVAERILIEFVRSRMGDDAPVIDILQEHDQYGAPDSAEVIGFVEDAGMKAAGGGLTSLAAWMGMMLASHDVQSRGWGREYLSLQSHYNSWLRHAGAGATPYRHVVLGVAQGDPASLLESFGSLPLQAETGAPDNSFLGAAVAAHHASLVAEVATETTDNLINEVRALTAALEATRKELESAAASIASIRGDQNALAGSIESLGRKVGVLEEFIAMIRTSLPYRVIQKVAHTRRPD